MRVQLTYLIRHILLFILVTSIVLGERGIPSAYAGPIYVYIQPGGIKKFSNRPPPSGTEAQVFTARKSSFSWYRVKPHYGGVNMFKLYGNKFDDIIYAASRATGLDHALIKAVIHAESGFNPQDVSNKGARGLMQLMPGTARDLGVRDSFSPRENIYGGSRYLAMLVSRFNGNLAHAIAAYNAGMDNVDKYRGIPPFEETRNYVTSVLRLHSRYKISNG